MATLGLNMAFPIKRRARDRASRRSWRRSTRDPRPTACLAGSSAVALISASVPGEVGKFDPQARRLGAEGLDRSSENNVSGVAAPFLLSPMMRGVSLKKIVLDRRQVPQALRGRIGRPVGHVGTAEMVEDDQAHRESAWRATPRPAVRPARSGCTWSNPARRAAPSRDRHAGRQARSRRTPWSSRR